jgi:hypothetical protein
MRSVRTLYIALVLSSCGTAAEVGFVPPASPEPTAEAAGETPPAGEHEHPVVDARPAPMHQPVPLFENGATARDIDAATAREEGYVVIDLGEAWTPYLFTERGTAEEAVVPNDYRATYLALARGEFPDDHHGERAASDRYLELFGIPPTLGLLRARFQHTRDLACVSELDTSPLASFEGSIAYEGRDESRGFARQLRTLERAAAEWMRAQHVETPEAIDAARLSDRDARRLADYLRILPRARAVRAAQLRLTCEGYYEGVPGDVTPFAMDWPTHEALAAFERRHRIYGWGVLGRDTLEMLRRAPMEGEQEAVIRVIAERAMHAAGVVEDGSVDAHYRGRDGTDHEVPNLEGQLRSIVIEAFGLSTPDSTLAFLESLGELRPDGEHLVAIRAPELPEYYGTNMDLRVEIDRGDVWYEFPYDDHGAERAQPTERRPRLSISVEWEGQHIPLARFGTTIGGWRSELIEGRLWWRYKNSPPGDVVWRQIVASPVWLPPESTPPRDLLRRTGRRGANAWEPNYHETGPSYASAYGLVAAYHTPYVTRSDGTIRYGADEGIRTHGSVDYNSIMRRHSHGCHRLHNHIAVRLMSFVLAHRPHRRMGQQALGFRRDLEMEGHTYNLAIDRGGYVFELEEPLRVTVREGRIRGERATPIESPLPRWDEAYGAFMLPDGGAVAIDRMGDMRSIPTPLPDGGLPAIPTTTPVPPAVVPSPMPPIPPGATR